ncbi:MAG: hypothetical protein TREMPRED_000148 [Tremellales sp. Tagirdzhanova-0007]|nr:MAG: hypothetical protein TREMPRED_000148 [Tremellales sp. Tagirdzhanova-0007]
MSSLLTPNVIKVVTLLAPSLALTTSTSILSYSIFLAPSIIAQVDTSPSLALRQIVYYFRNGKPIFPPAVLVNTALYAVLAYAEPTKRIGYSIAAAGSFFVIPISAGYMIPVTNDRILELEDRASKGGEVSKDEVKRLVGDFKRENWLRGGVYWLGAIVGLWTTIM